MMLRGRWLNWIIWTKTKELFLLRRPATNYFSTGWCIDAIGINDADFCNGSIVVHIDTWIGTTIWVTEVAQFLELVVSVVGDHGMGPIVIDYTHIVPIKICHWIPCLPTATTIQTRKNKIPQFNVTLMQVSNPGQRSRLFGVAQSGVKLKGKISTWVEYLNPLCVCSPYHESLQVDLQGACFFVAINNCFRKLRDIVT